MPLVPEPPPAPGRSGLGHELRSSLAVICGTVDLLLLGGCTQSGREQALDALQRRTLELQALVDTLSASAPGLSVP